MGGGEPGNDTPTTRLIGSAVDLGKLRLNAILFDEPLEGRRSINRHRVKLKTTTGIDHAGRIPIARIGTRIEDAAFDTIEPRDEKRVG